MLFSPHNIGNEDNLLIKYIKIDLCSSNINVARCSKHIERLI